jgi:hypothetical protein
MLQPLVVNGEIVGDLKPPKEIREHVLEQIKKLKKP